ncbi:condensin-2 complex subunit H2, partial [Arapaima gigas]
NIMDAAETRFAHLLQPIRDLTKNWEVDVASQLGEYLDELDKICISFDEGKTTMNFAEAALLIQSYACIYSKKVEYLYSLVYQALDLISRKKRDKQPPSVGQDGVDKDITFYNRKDEVEFLILDDISEKNSPNAEMKKDAPNGLEVIRLTPESLIPAEERDKKQNPLYSCHGEVLASCKDFRINNCTPHPSGIIQLDVLTTPSQFLRDLLARPPTSMTCLSLILTLDVASITPADITCPDAPLPPFNLSDIPDEGELEVQDVSNVAEPSPSLEDGGMDLNQHSKTHMDRHQATNERRVLRERPEVQHESEEHKEFRDPWRWLDPYATTEDKPMKTGKHFSIPRGVQDISGNKRKRKGFSRLQNFTTWFSGTLSKASNHKPKRGPTFAGLEDLYWSCLKERLKMQKTFHRKTGVFFCHKTFVEKSLELEGAEEQEEEAQPGAFCDKDAGDDLSDHDNCADEAPFPELDQQVLLTASQTDRMSYEDLVKKNVELFLVNSQKYAQETVLSRRVRDWEEKISPQLRLQEERLVFNIHDYGNQVMDMLNSVGQTHSFSSVVQGKESHEVCRYMLASLQLANDYTIEIQQEEGLEEAIDTMTLTLLSKQRTHDRFKTYAAPSIADAH